MYKMILLPVLLILPLACEAQLTCRLSLEQTGPNIDLTTAAVAGPPGKQGARGPPGDVIQCDCSDNTELRRRVEQLENVISSLKDEAQCNGLVYGKSCVRLLYTAGNAVTHARAADLCAFSGGKMLDIDSDDMFHRVYKYVKENWNGYFQHPTRNYVNLWLASRYINQKIVLSNGTRLDSQSLGFWHAGHPIDNGQTNMGLQVPSGPERPRMNHHGFFIAPSTHANVVPICHFAL